MLRDSGGIDALVWVFDPSEDGTVLEPVVYARLDISKSFKPERRVVFRAF
jgi:hypothetical protein